MRHQRSATPLAQGSGLAVSFILSVVVIALATTLAAGQTRKSGSARRTTAGGAVPRGTEMRLRLETTIDTKEARDGDRFTAVVLTPTGYANSVAEGHIARVKSSGKMTGKTELSLTFDRLRLTTGSTVPLSAQVVKIYDEGSAKEVDEEGTVKSGSQSKTTAVRAGGGAAIGAVVGAIAGGGKGAAIGAAVGGAAGAGSVLIQGSKKIKLDSGTELLIRTTR